MKKVWVPLLLIILTIGVTLGLNKWIYEDNNNSNEISKDMMKIVLLGDSNTEISYFTKENNEKKWSSIIAKELDAVVINLGKDGRRTSDFLKSGTSEELRRIRVGERWKRKHKNSDYFIITYGLNDAKYYDADKFENYTREIIDIIRNETNGEPVLMTNVYVPFPEFFSWDRNTEIQEYDDVKRKLAKELNVDLIDVNARFKFEWENNNVWDTRIRNNELWNDAEDEGKTIQSEWFDNIHYNEKGNEIVADEVINYFKEKVIIQ